MSGELPDVDQLVVGSGNQRPAIETGKFTSLVKEA